MGFVTDVHVIFEEEDIKFAHTRMDDGHCYNHFWKSIFFGNHEFGTRFGIGFFWGVGWG